MPEGPEVKRNTRSISLALSNSVLQEIVVESGRYKRNELCGLKEFLVHLPTRIIGAGCHGKFIYIMMSNGWNLWSTLGMTGVWTENESKHTRIRLRTNKGSLFYNDIRNFGTLKLVYGKHLLVKKLNSLGHDLLSQEVKNEDFLAVMRRNDKKNICKVIMNQSVLAGVGNYVKAESLWLAGLDPRKTVQEFEDYELLALKSSVEDVLINSYNQGGASFLTYRNFEGQKGSYSERFFCYNRKIDAEGNPVEKIKTPDGRTTHWSPKKQGDIK